MLPRPIDVNALVAGTSDLLIRTLGESVRIETLLADDVWTVETGPSHLENALLNLAVNSRDAMLGGGRLIVETANTYLNPADAARSMGVVPGPYVMISVSGTGSGMDADTLGRVFESFLHQTGGAGHRSRPFANVRLRQAIWWPSEGLLGTHEGAAVKIYLPRLLAGSATQEEQSAPLAWEDSCSESVLPGMAAIRRWPTRLDQRFMRVCLDTALGRPWQQAIRPPAVAHAAQAELWHGGGGGGAAARSPGELPSLNRASLPARGKLHQKQDAHARQARSAATR